ncbi:hypothetical protein BKA83DRAFT_4050422 [Pisolithus microcarpus]|nr:hypothetical protein BKA83DRAFT_4050422 [Pisolithus microcarpus]
MALPQAVEWELQPYCTTQITPPPWTLRFHLGQIKSHTVYEAEAMGLTLVASLMHAELDLGCPVTIFVDNHAVIQSGENLQMKPGHHIVNKFHRSLQKLHMMMPTPHWQVSLQWVPGHEGIPGNVAADTEAKQAAEGPQNSSPLCHLPLYLHKNSLPQSISVAIRAQRETSKKR